MKILFVRTLCPETIRYGSEMRSGYFVDYFKNKGSALDLMTMTHPSSTTDWSYISKNFGHFYYFDQRQQHIRLRPREKLYYLLPWQIAIHYAKNIQPQIQQIIHENRYDLIFIFKLEPVFYFLQLARQWHKKIMIDFDDMLSDIYRNSYKNIFTAIKNSCSLMLYEYKALAYFRRALVCSKQEKDKIGFPFRRKIGVVPNVFPIDRKCVYPPADNNKNLLFVGSLDYYPNLQGLIWFCQVLWPHVLKAFTDLKLVIIGKSKKDAVYLRGLLNHPQNTTIAINVASVDSYYQACFASLVPLINGSGTRLKILESISFNRPVLTTHKGVEGLDLHHQESIFIFKDAKSFIDAYRSLLDQNRYQEITAKAFEVLATKYSPEAFEQSMKENLALSHLVDFENNLSKPGSSLSSKDYFQSPHSR